jgi:hypothetical protein
MKTFETESHNTPEGATHYYFIGFNKLGYYKLEKGEWYFWYNGSIWASIVDNDPLYEATPLTVSEEPEWDGEGLPPVGTKCEALFIEHEHKGYGEFLVLGYHGSYVWMEYIGELSNTSKHYTAKVNLIKFRKPETEAEKMARERLENGKTFYQLMSDIETSVMNPANSGYPNEWDELRDDWQEVCMRQAEALGFNRR